MAEKVTTIMVIKVDLQCTRCYKKIKKILCKYPQIRDQIYDEKNNTVTITVVCCSPEKIKQKICCKGGDTIKGIEIKPPPKPKPPDKPKEPEKPKQPEKPKEPEKPKQPEKPKEPEKPKQPEKPKEPEKPKQPEKPKEPEKPKQPEKPKEPEKPEKPKDPPKPDPPPPAKPPAPPAPEPIPIVCPPANPYGLCCRECYEGNYGGPCFRGHGRPPPPCYEGYGRPVYDSWGGGCNRGYYPCRCDYEENPSACTIM